MNGGTRPGVRTFADRPNIWARASNTDLIKAGYYSQLVPKNFPVTNDLVRWCNSQFGYKHWVNRSSVFEQYFFFSKEEDKTAFLLRWQDDFEV